MLTRIHWRLAIPAVVLAGTLALMWRSALLDPGPTGLPGDLPNLHNSPGNFATYAGFVVAEAGLAVAMMRPWSYERNWGRALTAAVVFAPWVFLNIALLIHSGGIMAIHTFWLIAMWLMFVVTTLVSGAATMFSRSSDSDTRRA